MCHVSAQVLFAFYKLSHGQSDAQAARSCKLKTYPDRPVAQTTFVQVSANLIYRILLLTVKNDKSSKIGI